MRGFHVAAVSDIGAGDSTAAFFESVETSTRSFEVPILGAVLPVPSPSRVRSTGPSFVLLDGEEEGSCCDNVRCGDGREKVLVEEKDLCGSLPGPLGLLVMTCFQGIPSRVGLYEDEEGKEEEEENRALIDSIEHNHRVVARCEVRVVVC